MPSNPQRSGLTNRKPASKGWAMIGGCFGQFWPVKGEIIRPPSTARKAAIRLNFNLGGQFNQPAIRNSAFDPFMHTGWLDVEHASNSSDTAKDVDDFRIVHTLIISYN